MGTFTPMIGEVLWIFSEYAPQPWHLLQDWLTESARLISKSGHTVEWVTPLGLPVIQPYHRTRNQVVSLKSICIRGWGMSESVKVKAYHLFVSGYVEDKFFGHNPLELCLFIIVSCTVVDSLANYATVDISLYFPKFTSWPFWCSPLVSSPVCLLSFFFVSTFTRLSILPQLTFSILHSLYPLLYISTDTCYFSVDTLTNNRNPSMF